MGSPSCPQSPAELPAQSRDPVTTGPRKGQSTRPNAAQTAEGTLRSAVSSLTGRRNHKGKCCQGPGKWQKEALSKDDRWGQQRGRDYGM